MNLPVKNVEKSKEFFGKLGFKNVPEYTDENAACMMIDDNIYVMLLVEKFFKKFINDSIADTSKSTEVITAISADSPKDVDDLIDKAMKAGGKKWQDTMKENGMYGGSFVDIDGHVWEVMHMAKA
ncbi:MAG: VOC family protein [Micromonosporaceae bacterium]